MLLRQLDLVDKATAIAASHDLAVYQGVQVMGVNGQVGYTDFYDPSEAAEAEREADRLHLDLEDERGSANEELRTLFE